MGAGCAAQPDGGVPDDMRRRNVVGPRCAMRRLGSRMFGKLVRYSLTLWRGVVSGCGST